MVRHFDAGPRAEIFLEKCIIFEVKCSRLLGQLLLNRSIDVGIHSANC